MSENKTVSEVLNIIKKNKFNPKIKNEFSRTLRLNYTYLFSDSRNSHELRNGIDKLINSNKVLNLRIKVKI